MPPHSFHQVLRDRLLSELSVQDGLYSVSGTLTTAHSLDTVWRVVTDYERLSEVYSTVERSWLEHSAGKLYVVQARSSPSATPCRAPASPLLSNRRLPD